MITRQTSLSKNIVQFCRHLRHKGFMVGAEEEALALRALQLIDFSSNKIFRLTLKAILCRSQAQLNEFDQIFGEYWKELEKATDSKEKKETREKPKPLNQESTFKSLKAWMNGNKNTETEETATYSARETLSQKDFSRVPDEELEELMQYIKALANRLAAKANRRHETTHKINEPDLRRTLRKNLRRGGELLDIIHKKPKRNRVKLVLLCDVSKSMELYTSFLVQFMYAFQQVYNRTETFVFSTSLKRITILLKQKNFREAMQLLGGENSGWRDGTRIGESLQLFVEEYGKLVDKKTIVIILSDGWDTGNITALGKSMELIYSKAKKLIWLNPLAGYEAYRPDTAGMQAAIPFISVFAAVHNVESLKRLGKWL